MSDRPPIDPPRLSESGEPAMAQLLTAARQGGAAARAGARERVWRSLATAPTPTRARSRWLIPLGAAACAALAVLVFRPAPGPAPLATLALAAGEVEAAGADAWWSTAQVGARLAEGSRLRTAANSRAYARFVGAGALVGEGTRAALTRAAAAVVLQLDEGSVALSIRERSGRLEVRGDGYTVTTAPEVTTADFQVKVAAQQLVEVFVHEGTVRVRGPSTDLELGAGDSWSSRSGGGRVRMEDAEVAAARALALSGGEEATLRITGPAGAQIAIDGVGVGMAPLAVLQRVGSHQLVATRHGARVAAEVALGRQGTVFELPQPPLPSLSAPDEKPEAVQPGAVDTAAPLREKLKGPLSAAERDTAGYELARLLSRRGRHAEAQAIYEKLAAGGGAWAEPSLYEVGRLKLRHLGDGSGSVAAFADYRRRYPRGALAHEVALSSIEAQLASGATGEALAEMDAFLLGFGASERVDDVRFLRATVRRDGGDCAGALADYLLLLKSPRHADDALYFAAYCEQLGGGAGAARQHLTEYLLRFPGGRHLAEARAALGR